MNESELFHCRNEPRRSATKLLLLLLLLPAQIFWGAKSLLGLFVVPRVGGIEEDFFFSSPVSWMGEILGYFSSLPPSSDMEINARHLLRSTKNEKKR